MADKVPDDERDEVIQRLLKEPDNKTCFDCGSKNPKWCSANLAIFLCFQCSGTHRSYGVHISFVRSLKMDKWKKTELKQMELGGNAKAKEFYKKNGMMVDGKPDHKNPAGGKYKTQIKNEALKLCGVDLPKEVTQEEKKEEVKQAMANMNLESTQQKSEEDPTIVKEEPKEVIVKKPKKMVEADIFDFSDIKPVQKLALPENSAKPIVEVKKITQTSSNLAAKSVKLPSQDNSYNLGGLFQGNNSTAKGKQSLQAKKVDNINFDADDFFSQFDAVPETKSYEKVKKVEEKQEENDGDKKDENKHKGFTISEPAPRKEEEPVVDVSKRYDDLVDSGATAISSDMMFKKESENSLYGRNSEPEAVSLSQRLSDQYQAARLTAGSNGIADYKESAQQTAGVVMEKGSYLYNGAYAKGSQAKHAALDWFSSMTAATNENSH